MDSKEPKDAFQIIGCRLLCMRMTAQALHDLVNTNKAIRQDALDWFDPIRGRDKAFSFQDCMAVIGLISKIEAVRDIALSGDVNRITEIATKIEKQVSAEGKEKTVMDAAEDAPARQQPVSTSTIQSLQLAFR